MRAAHQQVFPAPPSAHDKETAMHPTISYHLATVRAAELRSQAERAALARAARHPRTHKLEHAAPRLAAAGRRLLTSLRPPGRWRGGDAGGWSGAQVHVGDRVECRD
jgi:hypothetical protein